MWKHNYRPPDITKRAAGTSPSQLFVVKKIIAGAIPALDAGDMRHRSDYVQIKSLIK